MYYKLKFLNYSFCKMNETSNALATPSIYILVS